MLTERTDLSAHVDRTLDQLRALPPGPAHGRPLSLSESGVNPADNSGSSDHYLRLLLNDVANVVGGDFLSRSSPALLEQFCIMSVHRGEPSGEVLLTLLNSFLRAYATPSLSESAVSLLFDLAALTAPQQEDAIQPVI